MSDRGRRRNAEQKCLDVTPNDRRCLEDYCSHVFSIESMYPLPCFLNAEKRIKQYMSVVLDSQYAYLAKREAREQVVLDREQESTQRNQRVSLSHLLQRERIEVPLIHLLVVGPRANERNASISMGCTHQHIFTKWWSNLDPYLPSQTYRRHRPSRNKQQKTPKKVQRPPPPAAAAASYLRKLRPHGVILYRPGRRRNVAASAGLRRQIVQRVGRGRLRQWGRRPRARRAAERVPLGADRDA